mgnify:CR=1 FL=1
MKTNFFSELSNLIDGVDLNLTIKKIEGQLTVVCFATPRIDDAAKNKIRPLRFTATAQELDTEFFEKVTKPLHTVTSWTAEMQDFDKSMALAEAESQRSKKREQEEKKNKEQAQKLLTKAQKLLNEEKKPRQAITVINEILTLSPGYEPATKLLTTAKEKAGMPQDLFN